MTIDIPSPNELREVADQIGLTLSDDDVTSFRSLMEGSIGALNTVDAMPDELPAIKYPRDGVTWPNAEENPSMAGTSGRASRVHQMANSKVKKLL